MSDEAWIEMRSEPEVAAAGGRLARLYKAALDPGQTRIDNVLKIHSLRPESLDGHLRLYRAVMHTEVDFSRREREMIGVAVSAINRCEY